jgi:sarcosine oxidase
VSAYDAIVVGTGGIGSAALCHLARRGLRTLGLDRFPPAHDRGSSHGQTRMIRQAYFEHPDYVPLVLRAYEGWHDLSARRGQKLFHEVGLLEVGSPTGMVVPGVLTSARQHGLEVEQLSPAEIEARFPGFRIDPQQVGVFEPRAGYLAVEACVLAHLQDAVAEGAELHTEELVLGWKAEAGQFVVSTERGVYRAGALVIAAGPWASDMLRSLHLPFEVRRKPQYWYQPDSNAYDVERKTPGFLFECAEGIFYGFPRLGPEGLKVAEHTGGRVVADPLNVDRQLDRADQMRVETFLGRHLPGVSDRCTRHSVCMYTLTPDENFVVDRHPEYPRLAFAAGLSGHGFKFAPTLGEALADLAIDGRSSLPIGFLRHDRPALRTSAN